ncbi:E3 ubiquitin-protein ligase UBR2-like isoform X2 [Artemia franciscana]|uniref:E3 ubiquitin-protein ligase n=1 Tax=Artemia franciscana TaxID=6661 RepID=A0AA88H4W8_ARTSF|nr:hypothetical protein QYM36_017074 [Artemia franciscana]
MRTLGGEQGTQETSESSSWDSVEQLTINLDLSTTPDQMVEIWKKNFDNGYLNSRHFRDYWKFKVPNIFSPGMNCDCLHIVFDEDEVKRVLLDPLEMFICGRDPKAVFKELSELDNPPALCGKVFRMGEPTYSCRDCGTDPTCVLCVDCFKRSAHKQHRYRLSMSVGGGYCDCGDPEAWKTEAFCENHAKGLAASEEGREKLMARMPPDVMGRTKIVFATVLKYAYQILTSELTMNLPQDLQVNFPGNEIAQLSLAEEEVYCTMLFNDETHTFEQVIDTLKRAIDCAQKEAVDFATIIDREGRCIVKCSNFATCNNVRLVIERQTSRQPTNQRPLKVVVMPAHVMAHQVGAMRLLNWLQQLLGCCEAFRILFSDIAMEASSKEMSVVEGILNCDTQLWKAARSVWHHLFISGLLMDFENKKRFAKIFTKYYNVMMKDFINDDHDHSYSISSLSVQLFTVPTISHHLISIDDVLAILLRFFTSECERRRNDEGKLSFERNNSALRRAMYVLYDLKYLLSSKPETWNEELRRGFLHGFDLLANLLGWMQGMDATKRQVGQHMEFEPEWEFAFNLHFKLAPVLSLIIDWCGTDKKVLTKVYRNILKKIGECLESEMKTPTKLCEVANHSVISIDYDVSYRPVSIHLPLSRIFAGLNLLLSKFGLDYYGFENISNKPNPVQIIEPVLRTQVMVAQVQAGMWRRNGYSLINQIYFYKNVKCRTEMFDRDITLLQVGASLIEPNEFLIHLLNKFDILGWTMKNYEKNIFHINEDEDTARQITILVEEFLNLIIQITGERHTPGVGEVTPEEQTMKEIIHQLCIEAMPHSALNKALPEDTSHETHIESVIDKIARFKKPIQGSAKGVYELKDEYFDQFDVFFYHYTREEMSRAEESQIKRRKVAGLELCCPPPPLPPFTQAFMPISNILQSDVMLYIFQTVFERTSNLRARTFSETQFHMVLHLIGYALWEEIRFLSRENSIGYHFTDRADKFDILPLMESLRGNSRIDNHKVLLDWTIRKYKEILVKRGTVSEPVSEKMFVDTEESKAEENEKKRRAKIAAARKAAIMAQMATAQKNFIMEHKAEFETSSEMKSAYGSLESVMDVTEDVSPVAYGPGQTAAIDTSKKLVCILCQEEQPVTGPGKGFVYGTFVQRSTVMCQNTTKLTETMDSMGKVLENSPFCINPDVLVAPFVSSCGHPMHASCWQSYLEGLIARERRRPRPRPSSSYDIDKSEFLCPLCQCLSNTVMPVLPGLNSFATKKTTVDEKADLSFEEWYEAITLVTKSLVWVEPEKSKENDDLVDIRKFDRDTICRLRKALIMIGRADVLCEYPKLSGDVSRVLVNQGADEMIKIFFQCVLTVGFDETINSDHPRLSMAICQAAAYTFLSTQNYLESEQKGLFELSSRQQDTLSSFARCLLCFPHALNEDELQAKILEDQFYGALETLFQAEKSKASPIDAVDPFSILVTLLVCSSVFSDSGRVRQRILTVMDLHLVRLAFAMQVIQSFLVVELPTADELMEEEGAKAYTPGQTILLELYEKVRGKECACSSSRFIEEIEKCCKPFLRCVALFGHFFCEVAAPPEMKDYGGDSIQSLLRYIGLESIEEIVQKEWFFSYAQRCLARRPTSECTLKYPLRGRTLIELPHDYSELINEVAQFTCPNSDGDESRTPTRCLLCGAMLCSQSYCCQVELQGVSVGACTNHAHYCGAGVGIFLRVRECKIMLLAGQSKGCYMPPPYLDKYGETDQGLRRGDPLHLCKASYNKWQRLWLSHSVQEHISHAMETSQSLLQTDWHHV